MKILATENELCPLILGEKEILLTEQIKSVHNLYLKGIVRELYQSKDSNLMIIVLECISYREAESYLAKLPLVRAGKSTFDIKVLEPYRGYMDLLSR